jgi:large subunit ribosomal protein L5
MAKKKEVAAPAQPTGPRPKPRLREYYEQSVMTALQEKFGYTNRMMIPKPVKVVLNMGMGKAVQNPKLLDGALADLATVSGQLPVTTYAKKSISNFKIRQGMPIGARVTLRGERMWEFLDRFINFALPRLRDFRGVPTKLSGSGDFTLGLKDQVVFPEIDYDKVDAPRGMNLTIVTSARNDEEGRELLKLMGMPFRRS